MSAAILNKFLGVLGITDEDNDEEVVDISDDEINEMVGAHTEADVKKEEQQLKEEEVIKDKKVDWEEAVKDSYNHFVSHLGIKPSASEVLEDVINNYNLNVDIEIDLDSPTKYDKWVSEVKQTLNRENLDYVDEIEEQLEVKEEPKKNKNEKVKPVQNKPAETKPVEECKEKVEEGCKDAKAE